MSTICQQMIRAAKYGLCRSNRQSCNIIVAGSNPGPATSVICRYPKAVDIVHGHSSHHPKGIEIYKEKPILYGCGDFLDDYEGIEGYEEFRDDLVLMYFPSIDLENGRLVEFKVTPLQIRNFRLNRPAHKDTDWLRNVLDRECRPFGVRVDAAEEGRFALHWG